MLTIFFNCPLSSLLAVNFLHPQQAHKVDTAFSPCVMVIDSLMADLGCATSEANTTTMAARFF